MKKNVMEMISRMYGLELGEKFHIKQLPGRTFMMTDCGLFDERDLFTVQDSTMMLVLTGCRDIIKLKDPYEEWCTAQEIRDLGIELEVDQKIFVSNYPDERIPEHRHFRKLKGSFIHTWNHGCTSHTCDQSAGWTYVKLVK